jgi:multicomponent Na+:H+ antiporter subunit C
VSIPFLYALVGVGLFCLGLHALIVHDHLLRKILAINVMGSGVFLVLAAMATRNGITIPDPVPHAMIITGIVVAVAATALALVLMLKLTAETGQAVLPGRKKEENL